ncbi:MAG: DUF3786 domain-containing protein [Spirochaetaceae bacterium]|jgi:hypothetical protein|nr:DUF3786 domain-containing protein [Spirochaetaceae bacterium]
MNRPNQKEEIPLSHYLEIYRSLDPREIGRRCALPFDGNAFSLTLMGAEYLAPHPAFALCPRAAASLQAPAGRSAATVTSGFTAGARTDAARTSTGSSVSARLSDPGQAACDILILRYLCEGRYLGGNGKRLSYNEVPWGPVYYRNFDGRCLKRLAYGFGNDIPRFRRIIETSPGLKAEKLPQGDAGYRIEFLSGLFISLILYAGDDEFPPSAQILFDDNLVFAFTAEDLAVAGEVAIDRLKRMG